MHWAGHRPFSFLKIGFTLLALPADALAATAAERVVVPPVVESADETVYADRPYWYKPGHPLNPADAAQVEVLPGFRVERILAVPSAYGSFTALTTDAKGRLLAAAQHEAGIYRITPPAVGDEVGATQVEKLGGAASKLGWSHGLLYAFDSLYVTVAEGNPSAKIGVHRLRDTDGDDQFDVSDLLFELKGGGEHGPHNMVAGPDGQSLYLMGGNGTALPAAVTQRRPVGTSGVDRLMPPGFEPGKHSIEGWVLRFDPTGDNRELMVSGLRNCFDLAFNRRGDLFTFDSDMEWDLGMPWYRPTRICHLVSGGEFGWRGGSAMWPEHLEDGVAPVLNIGPASPTGVVFGYGTRFPERYQRALFACDWTFATIHAIHLRPHGASYRAEVEEFVGGSGLPVTDITVGRDGALYFAVGGRRLGSAIYRVHYVGSESIAAVAGPEPFGSAESVLHDQRRALEGLHGRPDRDAIAKVWPWLGHADRAIRFAARVALEHQPVAGWRDRALAETDAGTRLGALLALARQGAAADQAAVIARLGEIPWRTLPTETKLRTLRTYELALARGGDATARIHATLRSQLRPHFPDPDIQVTRELSRLLCYLGDRSMIDPLVERMESDRGERPLLGSGYFVRNPKYGAAVRDMLEAAPRLESMHHASMLLWLPDDWTGAQRKRYFTAIADATTRSKGGHQYREVWNRIRERALEQIPAAAREEYEKLQGTPGPVAAGLPVAKGPGREWTMDQVLKIAEAGLTGRDLAQGRETYAAAACILCHPFRGEGGTIGPDLTTVGQRFTLRDIVDAILHPSRAIPDQYQLMTLELTDGSALSGRIVSRDEKVTRLATELLRPTESRSIPNDSIRRVRPEPVSTMPTGLLNALNEDEVKDLLAYLTTPAR